jgi:hypothetical protein
LELCKNLLICCHASLGKEKVSCLGGCTKDILELVHPREEGVVLKGIGPSLRFLVVGFEDIVS